MALVTDLIVRSHRVVAAGAIRPASVHIRGGKIVGVLAFNDVPAGCPVDEAGDAAVMPGVVDTHVHVPAPGSRDWDGLEPTTRAAAAGGVTTLLDMPSHRSPATTTAHGVRVKREAAAGKCRVDVGLWGGVVPGNERELAPMVEAGVLGFKCALTTSGADEYPAVSDADLRVAMPAIAKLGVPLLVHADCPHPTGNAVPRKRAAGRLLGRFSATRRSRRRYQTYLESRPKEAENEAIALMIGLCREFRTQIHILHLSSSDALTLLFRARSERLPITAETCPHYLALVADEIGDGATAFTCDPPIRERENREFLWAGAGGWPDPDGGVRSCAGPASDDGERVARLHARVARHLVAPGQPADHVDRGSRAGLYAFAAGRMDVPEAGATCRSQLEKAPSTWASTPTWWS